MGIDKQSDSVDETFKISKAFNAAYNLSSMT